MAAHSLPIAYLQTGAQNRSALPELLHQCRQPCAFIELRVHSEKDSWAQQDYFPLPKWILDQRKGTRLPAL